MNETIKVLLLFFALVLAILINWWVNKITQKDKNEGVAK